MAVISVLNQKGGVGKTTLTVNLGGVWARAGRRVLLVDNDPQASLTQGLLGPGATALLHPDATVAGLYGGTAVDGRQVATGSGFEGLSLIAGSEHAAPYNRSSPDACPLHLQACLQEALAGPRAAYDVILIDCPPNLNLCSWAALAASDAVLVPVLPEDYGAQGLPSVLRSIGAVRDAMNPGLRLLGFALSMVQPRRAVHRLYIETLEGLYGDAVFASRISEAAEVAEATMMRQPVAWYKPKGKLAKALAALASEIDGRVASWAPGLEAA